MPSGGGGGDNAHVSFLVTQQRMSHSALKISLSNNQSLPGGLWVWPPQKNLKCHFHKAMMIQAKVSVFNKPRGNENRQNWLLIIRKTYKKSHTPLGPFLDFYLPRSTSSRQCLSG